MSTHTKPSLNKPSVCTVCKEIPKLIRLYKCNMEDHITCYNCFVKLRNQGSPRCMQCKSVLLKVNSTHSRLKEDETQDAKLQDLFQLPKDNLNFLLGNTEKQVGINDILPKGVKSFNTVKSNYKISTITSVPMKCPHLPCGKAISSASIKLHFEYEHSDIKKYSAVRGEEILINSNASVIEHGMTNCIAMLEVFEKGQVSSQNFGHSKLNKKAPPTLFLILVSGSVQRNPDIAYAIYWLVTESADVAYQCTLEMTSDSNGAGCAAFCGVNNIRDDMSMKTVEEKMNCLCLSYGSLVHLKGPYGEINFHVTIH